jgi:hypothetical protein
MDDKKELQDMLREMSKKTEVVGELDGRSCYGHCLILENLVPPSVFIKTAEELGWTQQVLDETKKHKAEKCLFVDLGLEGNEEIGFYMQKPDEDGYLMALVYQLDFESGEALLFIGDAE